MKYQSRLTALLLALMMVITTVVSAEETTAVGFSLDDLTSAQVETFETEAEALAADKCTTCVNEFLQRDATIVFPDGYDCIYTYFATVTPIEAYDHLMDLWALYESEANDPTYTVYLNCHNTHVYNAINTEEAANYPSVFCNEDYCTASQWPVESPLHADHSETCPWHENSTALTEAEKLACTFKYHTAEADKPAFVAPIEEELFYAMLDVLGWVADTLASGDVTVVGAVPAGTVLATTAHSEKISTALRTLMMNQAGMEQSDCLSLAMFCHDVELNFYGREIEPQNSLTITYSNAWNSYYAADYVNALVLHVLESVDSINAETNAGRTVYYSSDATLVGTFSDTGTLAAAAEMGYADCVAYTLEYATPNDDCSVSFTVDSLSEMVVALDTFTDSAGHYVKYKESNGTDSNEDGLRDSYFYWRLEGEQTSVNANWDKVTSVTVSSPETSTNLSNVAVPHGTYNNQPSTLECNTIIGYTTGDTSDRSGSFADGTTVTWNRNQNQYTFSSETPGAFQINIQTASNWIVTSYRIGCEFGNQTGEGCQTVEAQKLTVVTDESGNLKSNLTIDADAKVFGHGSNASHYVLLLTIEEVSDQIDVTKTVSNKYVTYDEDAENTLTYTITAKNENAEIYYNAARFEDAFFKTATIKSVVLNDRTGDKAASYSLDTTDGKLTISSFGTDSDNKAITWDPGETITIEYEYTVTATDAAAGSLSNTVFVYAFQNGTSGDSDFSAAYVEVIINTTGFGAIQIYKQFVGLDAATVYSLVGGGKYQITVTDEDGTSYDVGVPIQDSSDTTGMTYYWNIDGIEFADADNGVKMFTITESGYDIEKMVCTPTHTVSTEGTAAKGTNTYTLSGVELNSGETTVVTFINTYGAANGSLAITKTVVNDTIYANDEDLADDEFTFTVTLKDASNVPLTGSVTYTIGTTPTTVTLSSEGKFTLSLKKDETATIADLPDGTQYTVTEAEVAGYTTTKSGDTGTIGANTTQTAAFVNAYVGAPLTITKAGTVDATDSFIFTVKGTETATDGVDMKVVITGAGTVTIANLPLGTYTVTEDTAWSWKYTANQTSASVTVDADGGSVTFTNTKTEKWLNDESSIHNDFSTDSE